MHMQIAEALLCEAKLSHPKRSARLTLSEFVEGVICSSIACLLKGWDKQIQMLMLYVYVLVGDCEFRNVAH